MADVSGVALVEIQPDLSRFEALLKTALESSIKKVESSASSTLKVSLPQTKAFEKSFSSLDIIADKLSSSFDQINSTLVTVSNSIQKASSSLESASKSVDAIAKNSRNINFGNVAAETSKVEGFLSTIQKIAVIISSAVSIGTNIATVVKGIQTIKTVTTGFTAALRNEQIETDGVLAKLAALNSVVKGSVPALVSSQKAHATQATAVKTVAKATDELAESTKKAIRSDGVLAKIKRVLPNFRSEEGSISLNLGRKKATEEIAAQAAVTVKAAAAEKLLAAAIPATSRSLFSFGGIADRVRSSKEALANKITNVRTTIGELKDSIPPIVNGFIGFGSAITKLKDFTSSLLERLSELPTAFKEVLRGALGLEGGIDRVSLAFRALGGAGAVGVVTGGFLLAGAAFSKFVTGAAAAASRLTESNSAVETTLGDATSKFRELIGVSSELGLSQNSLNEAIVPIIPLLKNAGLSGDTLAEALSAVVLRAVDLSSKFNKEVPEALNSISAGLRGELDPLERFGTSLTAATVDARLAALGFNKLNGQFSEQAKQLGRLQLILDRSKFAEGDFAATGGELAGSQRKLKAVFEDLRTEISKAFVPAATELTHVFQNFISQNKDDIIGFFVKLGPLVTSTGKFLASIIPPVLAVTNVFKAILLPSLTFLVSILKVLTPLIGGLVGAFLGIRTITAILTAFQFVLSFLPASLNRVSISIGTFGNAIRASLGPLSLIASALLLVQSRVKSTATAIEEINAIPADQDLLKPFAQALEDTSGLSLVGNTLFGILTEDLRDGFQTYQNEFEKQAKALFGAQFAASSITALKLVEQAEAGNLEVAPLLREEFDKLSAAAKKRAAELNVLADADKGAGKSQKTFAELLKESAAKAETLQGAIAGVTSAQKALADSQKGVTRIDKQLVQLAKDRKKAIEDTITPVRELAQAQDADLRALNSIRDLEKQRKDLLKELADLQTPATTEELASIADRITGAQIALNKAKKDQLDLEKQLAPAQKSELNLAGLSLDQIKSRLSNVRATLAAQEARNSADTAGGKTQAEIDDDRMTADIAVRDAQRTLNDAIDEQTKLQDKVKLNQAEIVSATQKLADLEIDVRDAARQREDTLKTLANLRAGETAQAAALKTIDDQVTSLNEQRKDAVQNVADNEAAIKKSKDDQALKVAEILDDEKTINSILLERSGILKDLSGLDVQAQKASFVTAISQLLTTAGSTEGLATEGGPINISPDVVNQISLELIRSPGSDVRATLKEIIKKLGLAIPGLAQGGVVTAPGMYNLGENFRSEAVLPLTRPARLEHLLGNPMVLHPVLNALERITLPSPVARGSLHSEPISSPPIFSSRRISGQLVPSAKPSQRDRKLDEIIQLLKEANNKNIEVHAPISIASSDPYLAARHAARELQRQMDRL